MTANHAKYRDAINLKTEQQRVVVESFALTNVKGKKVIEAQYAAQIQSWHFK